MTENKISLQDQMTEDEKVIHRRLLIDRSTRLTILVYLLSSLVFTIIYGTLQNPFQYTFSKIGNRFDPTLRVMFIVWASYTGFSIQASIIALFTLEKYKVKRNYVFVITAIVFLILSTLAPSLDQYPFWTWVHIITAGLFALFISLGVVPFLRWVARENPRLRRVVYVWMGIIWGGGFTAMFTLGNTGVFELWFFSTFILFLMYLCLTLFEENIIKESVILLRNEDDLNQAIEKYFIKEKKTKVKRVRKKKKEKQ